MLPISVSGPAGNGDMLAANNLSDVADPVASRSHLGLEINADVQAHAALLDAFVALTTNTDLLAYFTGPGTIGTTDFAALARSLIAQTTNADMRWVLGVRPGTDVQTQNARLQSLADAASIAAALAVLHGLAYDVEGQTITGGAGVTSKDLGNSSGVTLVPDPSARPLQHVANNGAFTLNPPTIGGAMMLDVINGGSAGAITLGSWTKTEVGAGFDTTSGHAWRCHISKGQGGSLLIVEPLF